MRRAYHHKPHARCAHARPFTRCRILCTGNATNSNTGVPGCRRTPRVGKQLSDTYYSAMIYQKVKPTRLWWSAALPPPPPPPQPPLTPVPARPHQQHHHQQQRRPHSRIAFHRARSQIPRLAHMWSLLRDRVCGTDGRRPVMCCCCRCRVMHSGPGACVALVGGLVGGVEGRLRLLDRGSSHPS